MAHNEEQAENTSRGKIEDQAENTSRGNEWEVVSLTASAYAAAPGPDQVDLNDDEKSSSVKEGGAGTPDAMYMSRHFVFPPSQHENLPLAPENIEIHREQGGGDAVPQSIEEEGGKSDTKNQDSLNIKDLTISDEYPGIPIFDEKGNILSVSGTELEGDAPLGGLNLVDKEQSFYGAAKLSSFQNEPATVVESMVTSESVEFSDHGLDSGFSNIPKHMDKDKYDETNLPCEAWWKKQAASLYANAKEANAFWSIFVAAAVMGIVIIGQRWQQERWQVLQLKWQFGVNDERMSRMLGPLSRLKDVIVGGNRQGSLIRGSSSMER